MKTIRETEHAKVIVMDEPGEGGACHRYMVKSSDDDNKEMTDQFVYFQKGPIQENGVNGCQIEDLFAICIHRLKGFQAGDFPCTENEVALGYAQMAIALLESRTKDRINRGVGGENKE
jgi:hypothetical protein